MSGSDHYYVNFGYYVKSPSRLGYGEGGRLCRLNLRTGEVRALLDDPRGGVRDPQVHYDGQKILFSYRRGGDPYYHLHEIHADGTGLRQLTDGPYDDIEPAYLPDGGIVFGSSRCNRIVACWYTPVAILYRCEADGSNIRPLSSSIVHDNTPRVLPDGRVLYTRWEYVDRAQVAFHHLWTINPDGTGQMAYYGNQLPGTVMIDATPIPGTQQVVASFSPGHGVTEHQGHVTVVDPSAGPDARLFARRISASDKFRDPYPLSEDTFLVASGKQILLMDARGRTSVLYELSEGERRLEVHEPVPLRPRPRERVIPPRVDPGKETGRLVLVDVTYGRNMAGVARGEVKKLLVLEQLPKPANFSGGQEPLTLGGSFTLKRILGTVPVEPDGSAHFEVPALRSLFFVALDANDLSVKRMQSFVTVQPGETTTCAGCHEPRTATPPPAGALLATNRPPSRIEPIPGIPEIFDFPRDIQPILDKHCVRCHDYEAHGSDGPYAGRVALCGDRGPTYCHSYYTLLDRRFVSHSRNAFGNRPPRSIGSSASPLLKLLDGSHYGAKLTPHERAMVRLWIEAGVFYPGTYAALGTGMARAPALPQDVARRCAACHAKPPTRPDHRPAPKFRHASDLLCNLTRPELSLLLLAPLAREAGGYGLCNSGQRPAEPPVRPKPAGDEEEDPDIGVEEPKAGGTGVPPVAQGPFSSTADPDYQKLLNAILGAKMELDRIKRFDMPGFRPNEHYIREMKRCGGLPANLGPEDPIDCYAADGAYWRTFWYRPAAPH